MQYKVTITVAEAKSDDLLGLKEEYAMVTEGAGRVVRIDVREVEEQMRMEG